ncbi:hypothetical protein [Nonomuraea sp. NPDC050643]|uniref:hypothetical protein n=1 Tax=Nonomuraea sp. NPDC050643 TaxID=3155660 RepID=UPI0034013720
MRYAWLCHPVTVAGVLVLLVNDHLLKQAWPGFVTGKLSDVAGLVVAPALLALLFWRRADLAATLLTGVLFAVVKSTETGAEAASQVWTWVAGPSRVLADPTDLLALPALALAWWIRHRSLRGPGSARRRLIVTMPLAVLAVTATAAAPPPLSADSVEIDSLDRIVVHNGPGWAWISEDGGRTWAEGSAKRVKPPQSAQCVPGQATRCYRVAKDRMAVEQSDDGGRTWQPSWRPSEDDLERMARQYDRPAPALRAMALTVQARSGGHTVVVANGLDGIVVRDPSGTWQRLGRPGTEPAETDLDPELTMALFLAVCMLFGGVGAGLRQYGGVYLGFAAASCIAWLSALAGWFQPGSGILPDGPAPLLTLTGVVVTMGGAVVCLALAIAGRARPAPVAVGVLGAPLIFVTVFAPFYGWSQGTPGPYWVAVGLAVVLTAAVLVAGAAFLRHDARSHLDG